jgi:hypothetical protein
MLSRKTCSRCESTYWANDVHRCPPTLKPGQRVRITDEHGASAIVVLRKAQGSGSWLAQCENHGKLSVATAVSLSNYFVSSAEGLIPASAYEAWKSRRIEWKTRDRHCDHCGGAERPGGWFRDHYLCSACLMQGFSYVIETNTESGQEFRETDVRSIGGAVTGAVVGGLLLGPIGAYVGAAVGSHQREVVREGVMRTVETCRLVRACPMCKEFVKPDALICRHCSSRFDAPTDA